MKNFSFLPLFFCTKLHRQTSYSVSSIDNNGDVTFTDNSTNGLSWAWNFGDVGTSNLQNPVHNYSISGREIFSKPLHSCGSNFIEVQIPKGYNLMKLTGENLNKTLPVIV